MIRILKEYHRVLGENMGITGKPGCGCAMYALFFGIWILHSIRTGEVSKGFLWAAGFTCVVYLAFWFETARDKQDWRIYDVEQRIEKLERHIGIDRATSFEEEDENED